MAWNARGYPPGGDSAGYMSLENTLGGSLHFTINDVSKFQLVTVSDDDLRLNQYWDIDRNQEAVDFTTDDGADWPVTFATKAINELPGGRIHMFNDQIGYGGWITFSGLEPGAIKEGVEYSLSHVAGAPDSWGYNSYYADSPLYSDLYVACFTLGTLIETNEGNKPIEELVRGDLIATLDDGYQPIRWIGHTARDAIDLAQN